MTNSSAAREESDFAIAIRLRLPQDRPDELRTTVAPDIDPYRRQRRPHPS
jgi:hypothetical protein